MSALSSISDGSDISDLLFLTNVNCKSFISVFMLVTRALTFVAIDPVVTSKKDNPEDEEEKDTRKRMQELANVKK